MIEKKNSAGGHLGEVGRSLGRKSDLALRLRELHNQDSEQELVSAQPLLILVPETPPHDGLLVLKA